jgi:putative Holliday junction resolvase
MRTPKRLLGVDVGERRIGIARSEGRTAVPLTIVAHRNRDEDLARVAAVTSEQEADAVVVGLPLLESGEEGEQARRARRFGDALARRIAAPVVYHDERYSTWRATNDPGDFDGPMPRRRGRRHVDDSAAAVILQSYIDADSGT